MDHSAGSMYSLDEIGYRPCRHPEHPGPFDEYECEREASGDEDDVSTLLNKHNSGASIFSEESSKPRVG